MAFTILFCLAALLYYSEGTDLTSLKEPSPYSDWIHYKDQKFLKIVKNAGCKTQEDAEMVCKAYSEGYESHARLVTIKTKEEQEFLEKFLFVDNQVKDNVWLGLKEVGKSGKFEWNDGSRPYFTNWANQTTLDDEHHCVEMESGGDVFKSGLWVKVVCDKSTAVVCERTQTLTLDTLQTLFFNYKLEQRQELSDLKQKIEEFQNGVPVGFIYAQLPGQAPPTTLWPGTNWTDVSAKYAGLFFRVDGGKAAPFGQVQQANTTRLEEVHFSNEAHKNPISIPHDGSWSEYIASGSSCSHCITTRYRLSKEEVRPRNQAMRLWQKIH